MMKQFRLFLSTMLLASPAKKGLYALYGVVLAGTILFLHPLQTLLWENHSPDVWIQLRVLLFILSSAVCSAAEYAWIKTNAYRYFCTLPITRSLHLVSLLHRMTVMVLLYLLASVFLGDQYGLYAVVQVLYTALLLVAVSSFLTHILYILLKHTVKRKYGSIYLGLLLGFFATIFIILILRFDVPTHKSLYQTLIQTINQYCLTPNTPAAALSMGWLFLLRSLGLRYRPIGSLLVSRKYSPRHTVYSSSLKTVLYKDFHLIKTTPSYLGITLLCLLIGIYSARYQFDASVNTIIALVLCVISSTLSEELMKPDMNTLSLLKTLPVRLASFYRAKIMSVCVWLTIPALLFLFVTLTRSTFTFIPFLLAILSTSICCYAFCTMQCMVIFKYRNYTDQLQLVLLFTVFLSVLLPVFPFLYLAFMGRKTRYSFCEGRE